jgi:hypothetical protein
LLLAVTAAEALGETAMGRSKTNPDNLLAAAMKSGGWISIEKLAAQLGCSVRTVRRMHARAEGPPRYQAGRKQAYRQHLDEWLKSRGENNE